jgi:glycosyltransferase involved in cell wall biosynthesis
MNDIIEISDRSTLPEHPLISVYMLAYRHEHFIAAAIESIVSQRCDFPIELIIGEDCSPDRTREVALDYQRRHPELIRVLYGETNVGAKRNNERCQAAARGKYVAICEADDYWCDPDKLAIALNVFHYYPQTSLVFHAARVIDANNGHELRPTRWPFRSRKFTLSEMILGDGGLVPTASIMVRRSILDIRPAWIDSASVGDYPLVLNAAARGDVVYLDRTMCVYRSNVPHSWTQRHTLDFGRRLAYATQIDEMLSGLEAELPYHESSAIRTTISKYYSDVIVRANGSPQQRAELYTRVKQRLLGSDNLIAWLAATYGIRLPGLKDVIRRTKTVVRLLRSQFRPTIRPRELASVRETE